MAQGRLLARLAVRNGQTRLIEHQQSYPLKIARTFERTDGGLDICIMDASPGLLAGDRYEIDWILEPGARARIVTQGATRIHPSQGEVSEQIIRAEVNEGARLELWPESTIPFREARLKSTIQVSMHESAEVVLFESLSAGRVARGETFHFHSLEMTFDVRDEKGLRLFSRNKFGQGCPIPTSLTSWGSALQWASLFYFSPHKPDVKTQLMETLQRHALQGGFSYLMRDDLAIAMLGRRAHDLRCCALEMESLWHKAVSRETI